MTTATATISATVLANRAAKRNSEPARKCNRIMAKALSGTFDARICAAEDDFRMDSADRKVRVTKATDAEIATFLRGNRVVDTMDVLEQVGEAAFNNLVANGSLRRDASFNRFRKNNTYWISKKACEVYGIPAHVTLAGGATVELLD